MLNFFRRIRISLLESGKARIYLFYALGEIALVVIGILIALQVNNGNEARKDRILEKDYLQRFLSDLRVDSVNYELIEEVLMRKMEGLRIITRLLKGEQCCADSIRISIRRSATLGWALIDEGSDATFQEMISSGDLRLLRNNKLRQGILKYYKVLNSTYHRTDKRRSEYPNLTYQVFDLEGKEDDAEWFWRTLKENNAETEFRRYFRHETSYANFIEKTVMPLLTELHLNLKKLILLELEGMK